MQNYSYPSSSDVVITGIGNPTGQPVPTDAVFIAGQDPSNNLRALHVDASGNLLISLNAEPLSPLNTSDAADGPVTPGTVAGKSLLVGIQYNSILPTLTTGQQAALQADSSGRLILSPLTTASTINIDNISGTISLPTGASTSALQTQISGQLPATLGQKTMATSLAIAIASDQSAIPVSQSGSWIISGTVTADQGTTPWSDNISQIGGAAVQTGHGTAAGSLRVELPTDGTGVVGLNAGTNNIGSIANITGTVSLPTGAATSANQTNGSQKTQIATPTALTITQAGITVGTTAVRLTVSGTAPASTRVVLVATPDSASTAKFYIGSSTVTSSGATAGIQIIAGQSFIANNDAGDYYIISDTASQTVYVMEQA